MGQLRTSLWTIGLCAVAVSAAAADLPLVGELSAKGGCALCHAADKKLIGPSNRDIAARYKGRPDAVAVLTASVRQGSKGVWGTIAMPPTPPAKLSDADLRSLIGALLK